jgi:hypothetical protein
LALPLGVYFYLLSRHALNIPYFDDHALKAFILNFEKSDSLWGKIHEIFAQHNEHRIGITRLCILLIYWIQQTMDFRWLMFVGNAALMGIVYWFYRNFEGSKLWFVPVGFLIFTQMLWENTYWGMASVQNFGILFFVFGTFHFLVNSHPKNFNRALLFTFFAVFTSGNGILVLPIGLVLLILQRRNSQAWYFLGFSVLMILLYFFDYQKPPNPSRPAILKDFAKGLFTFLGNAFDYNEKLPMPTRMRLCSLAGLVILLLGIFYCAKIFLSKAKERFVFVEKILIQLKIRDLVAHQSSQKLFYLACLIFLMGTSLVVVWGRASFGIEVFLTSRYKIYSLFIVAILYLLIVQNKSFGKVIFGFSLLGSVIFWFWMNWQYYGMATHHLVIAENFKASYNDLSGQKLSDKRVPYTSPKFFYDLEFEKLKNMNPDSINNLKIKLDSMGHLEVSQAPRKLFGYVKNQIFVLLKSPKRMYLFATNKNRTSPWKIVPFFDYKYYFTKGFQSSIDLNFIDANTYQVGLVSVNNDKIEQLFLTTTTVEAKDYGRRKPDANW